MATNRWRAQQRNLVVRRPIEAGTDLELQVQCDFVSTPAPAATMAIRSGSAPAPTRRSAAARSASSEDSPKSTHLIRRIQLSVLRESPYLKLTQ